MGESDRQETQRHGTDQRRAVWFHARKKYNRRHFCPPPIGREIPRRTAKPTLCIYSGNPLMRPPLQQESIGRMWGYGRMRGQGSVSHESTLKKLKCILDS